MKSAAVTLFLMMMMAVADAATNAVSTPTNAPAAPSYRQAPTNVPVASSPVLSQRTLPQSAWTNLFPTNALAGMFHVLPNGSMLIVSRLRP